ncbi:MAG: prepilin-type N-terminal cleavage/methylation domain-containing protein [Xanthomonadales bacterium]|nr:prepilin-type N-terminal cleavage/methylation domain-containing protein [Xanthomonadales bacterium]
MYLDSGNRSGRSSGTGFTLVELMIAMFIMMVVAVALVEISANVFRSNTESIHMVQLSQEMRSAIQLISRDIRRAGYNDDSLAGYLSTQAISSGVTMGALDENDTANCLQVRYDDLDGNAKNVVYRLRTINEIGRVSAHFDADADCDLSLTDTGWVDISDPILTDVSALEFVRDNQLTDIAENLSNGNTIQVGLEQVRISISATLRSNDNVNRTIVNEVQIRNQYLTV